MRGFTLIELLVAIAVVAILAAIAYPNYRDQIMKSRRRAAEACLMELAQWMERHYTTNMTYEVEALPQTECRQELEQDYTFRFAEGQPTRETFEIEAEPTKRQRGDRCGTLSIDHLGRKGSTGSGWDCW